MNIKTIQRPWARHTKSQGVRNNDNSIYQTSLWKRTRKGFIASRTWLKNGRTGVEQWLKNLFCHICFMRDGSLIPVHTVDHIVQYIKGGSFTDHANLQGLCARCHARKSATEANAAKKQKK